MRLWVDSVQLRRSDQAVEGGGAFTSAIRSRKQVVLATDGNGAQGPFGYVVVDLHAAIVAEAHQGVPARERITDRRRGVGLLRELRQRSFEPLAHRVQ